MKQYKNLRLFRKKNLATFKNKDKFFKAINKFVHEKIFARMIDKSNGLFRTWPLKQIDCFQTTFQTVWTNLFFFGRETFSLISQKAHKSKRGNLANQMARLIS